MREILFRGKRIDNGEWVYGDFVHGVKKQKEMAFIWSENETPSPLDVLEFAVDPATVGQYTGLNDGYGKRIFEGDIVAQPVCKYTVEFDGGAFFLVPIPAHNPYCCPQQLIGIGAMFEVIGNIHDNPELMEGYK